MKKLLSLSILSIVLIMVSNCTHPEYNSKEDKCLCPPAVDPAVLAATYPNIDTNTHVCYDFTHEHCDGVCPCDGMECWPQHDVNTSVIHSMQCQCDLCMEWTEGHERGYTIVESKDSIWVYDGKELINN